MPKQRPVTDEDQESLRAASIFKIAYKRAKLNKAKAQLLNKRGDELRQRITALIAELTASAKPARKYAPPTGRDRTWFPYVECGGGLVRRETRIDC